MSTLFTFAIFLILAAAHLVAGVASLYALVWFSDSLDRAATSRRFDALAAALIIGWPFTLGWLLLKLAAAPARQIIERRGRP